MPIAMFDLSYYVTQNCLVRTVVKAPKYFHITPSWDLCTGSRLMNALNIDSCQCH